MIIRPGSEEFSSAPPSVSIVVAAYNSSAYIGATLDSIQAQTFSDYEVIVINDGSDDSEELRQILNSHPLPIVYISQQNKGVAAARTQASTWREESSTPSLMPMINGNLITLRLKCSF
jgi:glycosyltransferase involved in cell wall biosynthesis